ncbi:MAG: DUF1698 domain-containing protein [Leptolyngbyaceae cyanobacterium SM1_3_5]|nr:DUF1698 domain-containing protein [Leptolyngbyaceae cyanobacterium SM1_3_5]
MFKIEFEYPTSSSNKPRYTKSQPNKYISKALESNHEIYRNVLQTFPKYFEYLRNIDIGVNEDAREPHYINPYLPAFDSVSLYCLIAELKPNVYIEVGSGNSTKFARRAISDHRLDTQIISIDPYPRAEIDSICDRVIRQPVEEVDLSIFDHLQKNDIVFIDNSHRCFMNSDVTICFLDIMPRLNPGVYLQIHDIFWPLDYPESWQERYYNEQYLLGALLANGLNNYEIVLPVYYASFQPELSSIISPLWSVDEKFDQVYKHGGSFWMRRKPTNQDSQKLDDESNKEKLFEDFMPNENERTTKKMNENSNHPIFLDSEVFVQTNNHLDEEAFLAKAYLTYLERPLDITGIHHYFHYHNQGLLSRQGFITHIQSSAEFKSKAVAKIPFWFHSIDLGDGVITPGYRATGSPFSEQAIGLPESLEGMSVLDIGAWDGFYSFAAESRGASRVLATDEFVWKSGNKAGFELARKLLNSKVEDMEIDVLELSPNTVGVFDVVLFLGVLYHMRHPLLALERVASVTASTLILQTHLDMLDCDRPAMAFYPETELGGDPTNWCGVNLPMLKAMLKLVGFPGFKVVYTQPPQQRGSVATADVVCHAWR